MPDHENEDRMKFQKATKKQAKARIAIAGPSGSGKTYTALAIGCSLGDGRVALLDTEHGSASKYADIFDFDALDMGAPFHPDRFVEAIKAAADGGYGVLVLDSLSHAWNGAGGLLEIVDEIGKRMRSTNTFAAWKDATPIQNRLVEAMLSAPIHIIATMRSKQEYVLEQVERNGRTISQPKKVGMAPIQRDSFEYEFDIFGEMTTENELIISKTRCPSLAGRVFAKPGAALASEIAAWLSDGAEVGPLPPFMPEKNADVSTQTGEVVEHVKPIATEASRKILERYIVEFVGMDGLAKDENKTLLVAAKLAEDEKALSKHVEEGIAKLKAMLNKHKPLSPIEAEAREQEIELGSLTNA
jgi:hypothetical protein